MRPFFHRHQPPARLGNLAKAGLGGAVAIAAVALLSDYSGVLWLMAPFGASCVLVFALPGSPLSQPANVVGGHLVSTAIGLAAETLLPGSWWAMALAVGASIAVMQALRLTHPPAGADPLVVMTAHPGPLFLLFPVLSGSLLLVTLAWLLHRLPPRTAYPLPID